MGGIGGGIVVNLNRWTIEKSPAPMIKIWGRLTARTAKQGEVDGRTRDGQFLTSVAVDPSK